MAFEDAETPPSSSEGPSQNEDNVFTTDNLAFANDSLSQDRIYGAPIHRLPPEILAKIFLLVCTSYYHLHRIDRQYSCMRVCHYWNDVVQSTPNLWTGIALDTNYELKGLARPDLRLSKSKSCPIQIFVNCIGSPFQSPFVRSNRSNDRTSIFFELWKTIARHLYRAEAIEITLRCQTLADCLLPLPGALPSLADLTIVAGALHVLRIFTPSCVSPLRTFYLSSQIGIGPSTLSHISSRELESLNLRINPRTSPGVEVAKLLSRSPRLRNLYLMDCAEAAPSVDESLPDIISPYLESAGINGKYFGLISSWNAPRLSSLEIAGTLSRCRKDAISFPSLITLHLLLEVSPKGAALVTMLSSMPSLQHIHIEDYFACEYLSVLHTPIPSTYRGRSGEGSKDDSTEGVGRFLCPRLRQITLDYSEIVADLAPELMRLKELIRRRNDVSVLIILDGEDDEDTKKQAWGLAKDHPDRVSVTIY